MTEVSDEMNELMDIRRQCRLNQWSMMVQEREDSGLSIRAYCEQKGIGVKTYYYRLKKLCALPEKTDKKRRQKNE